MFIGPIEYGLADGFFHCDSLFTVSCPVGFRAMATEEKKPETEAARAQPTPSSSATQSKVCPTGTTVVDRMERVSGTLFH